VPFRWPAAYTGWMRSIPALLVAAAAAAGVGCGASRSTADPVCVRAWNGPGNAANRRLVTEGRTEWDVAVSRWSAAPAGGGDAGHGCSYFFSTKTRWLSVSAESLKVGGVRWGAPPTQGGARTPEQQLQKPNATLEDDGTLR